MKRREFVKLMGLTSGIMATAWDPVQAREKLVSHLLPPIDDHLPDQAILYRSVCSECPAACGLQVAVREGHPIKLEGAPDDPFSHGGLCLRGQASLARLYHPERVRQPLARNGENDFRPITWEEALLRINEALDTARGAGRCNVYLSGQTTGALGDLIDTFGQERSVIALPEIELYNYGALRTAYEALFGRRAVPAYRIAEADRLITVGADLLESFLHPVRFAHELAGARERGLEWTHLETGLSLTGMHATRRLSIRPGSEAALLAHLLNERELPRAIRDVLPQVSRADAAARTGLTADEIAVLTTTLTQGRHPLLIAGGIATAQDGGQTVALLSGLLQWASGQIGSTIDFGDPEPLDRVGTLQEVRASLAALDRRPVGVCLLARLHSLDFLPEAQTLAAKAKLRVGLGDLLHAPMAACDLVLPLSHRLECEDDLAPRAGWRQRTRPVFAPLFDTRSEGDILLQLMGRRESFAAYRDRLWADLPPAATAAERPRRVAPTPAGGSVELRAEHTARALAATPISAGGKTPALVLASSLRGHDGRSRVMPLLHEIPDPISAVSYGNYLSVSEADCARLGLADGSVAAVTSLHGRFELPVRCQPGQPNGVLSLGIDVVASGATPEFAPPIDPPSGELLRTLGGVTIEPTGRTVELPILAGGYDASGRGILPGDHGAHGEDSHGAHPQAASSLYRPPEHSTYRWAMAIDLDRCTGCSACVASCYVENNLPVAGPHEHLRGREMSWLRIQPYLSKKGSLTFLPMLCQHCTNAPCESVCPVYATYHNPEGLNTQVYNRCVGTRYCANNCPYKARRFNWLAYDRPHPMDLMTNPEVSIRPRGVMEKCTFCVQRIRAAKDLAKDEKRAVRDGDVVPACAQSCPAQAIVFGNLLDKRSRIYALAHSPRVHRVLEALGTEPAVYYLHEDNRDES